MSRTRSDVLGDILSRLRELEPRVLEDEEEFSCFGVKDSDKGRTDFLCGMLGISRSDFSLTQPLPFDEWAEHTEDKSRVLGAIYLLGMRARLFTIFREEYPALAEQYREALFLMESTDDFWAWRAAHRFHRIAYGSVLVDTRVLN